MRLAENFEILRLTPDFEILRLTCDFKPLRLMPARPQPDARQTPARRNILQMIRHQTQHFKIICFQNQASGTTFQNHASDVISVAENILLFMALKNCKDRLLSNDNKTCTDSF